MNFLLDHDVPEELSYLLEYLGHQVRRVREELSRDAPDATVFAYAVQHGLIIITCNRDDFLQLAHERPHHGVVIVVRRRSRAAERAALLRLIERAGCRGSWATSTSPETGEQLGQVVVNLVQNAMDAMPAGGTLTIATGRTDGVVTVENADTGSAVAPEDAERIFRPFLTTKPLGAGLGLAIAREIVQEHGGTLTCRSQPGGACFVMTPVRSERPRMSACG